MTPLESSHAPSLGTPEPRAVTWCGVPGKRCTWRSLSLPAARLWTCIQLPTSTFRFSEAWMFYILETIYSLGVTILTYPIKSTELDSSLWLTWNQIRFVWKDLLLNSKRFCFPFPCLILGVLALLPEISKLVSSLSPSSFLSSFLPLPCPSEGFNGLLQSLGRTAFRCQATLWKEAHAAAAQTERARLLQWCCGLISTSLVLDTKGNISRAEG